MKLSFLDNVFNIKDTNSEGLLIEAFGNDLFIPYSVLNEAKSEAPLYRVLGPNGCVSAIRYTKLQCIKNFQKTDFLPNFLHLGGCLGRVWGEQILRAKEFEKEKKNEVNPEG